MKKTNYQNNKNKIAMKVKIISNPVQIAKNRTKRIKKKITKNNNNNRLKLKQNQAFIKSKKY